MGRNARGIIGWFSKHSPPGPPLILEWAREVFPPAKAGIRARVRPFLLFPLGQRLCKKPDLYWSGRTAGGLILALVEQVAHRPAARRYRCQSPRTQDLYPRNLDDLAEYGPEYPGLVFQKMKVRFTGGYRQSGQRGSMACGMNDNMYAFFLPIDHWHLYCLINSGVSR